VNAIRHGLHVLDGLESLGLEADIGRAQVREGLRRLEGLPVPAAPSSQTVPGAGVQPSAEQEQAEESPHSAQTGAHSHASSLRLRNAVSAAMVQQALSMHDGALAPALNALVSVLWPRINDFVRELIYKDIEPTINSSLPSMIQGRVKFTKVSLGSSSPTFGPLNVEHRPENGDIELHIGIKFASDLDVELTAVGVPVGITKISLDGTLVCLLTPSMSKPPFFGGIQVFFPNPPEVGINFAGAAKVANVPGLRGAVRGAVADGIAGVCVLPRRIAVDMDEEDSIDIIDLTYPEPTAVLRVTLLSASGLAASDVSLFGNATSDPYVVATLGCKTWTSPTVKKNLNPVWGEEGKGLVVDFLVHSERQALSLKVFDYDFGSSDDLIGVAEPLGVDALKGTAGKSDEALQHELPLTASSGDAGAGKLCLTTEVLALTSDRARARMEGPSVGHLSVKLLRVTGLGSKAEFPFKVRIRVLGAEAPVEAEPSGASRRFLRAASRELTNLAKGRPTLKEGKTVQLGSSSRQVVAESVSAASTPPSEKQLAEALQSACAELAARGDTTEEIARVLGVDAHQVQAFLTSRGNPSEADRVAREAAAQRAASRPHFGEVVQLLLPMFEDCGIVELALLDKRQHVLGTAELPMQQFLGEEDLRLEGPFELSGADGAPASADSSKLSLEGSLWLKWLA